MDWHKPHQRWLSGSPAFGPHGFTRWRRLPRLRGRGLMFVGHKPHKIGRALATAEDRRAVSVQKQSRLRFSHPRPPTCINAMTQWARFLTHLRFTSKWGRLNKNKIAFRWHLQSRSFSFWHNSANAKVTTVFLSVFGVGGGGRVGPSHFIKPEHVNQSHNKGYGWLLFTDNGGNKCEQVTVSCTSEMI